MRIEIVTPAPPRTTSGNRITAERWAKLLKTLSNQVSISEKYSGSRQVDLLIALHARRSQASIVRFRKQNPERPIILALTGTDVYRDIHKSSQARQSLRIADRVIVLQPYALHELSPEEQKKARVIYQSLEFSPSPNRSGTRARDRRVNICVIGHLRAVKDPFRAAMAARALPESSRIRVVQVGSALSKSTSERARREQKINPRFQWLGEVSHTRALRVLMQSRLCVISSRMEGGANVLSEAIVAGVPVLASCIPGNIGILGENYPGLFRVGDTRGLRDLMLRAESDRDFLRALGQHLTKLRSLFKPERERRAWSDLISELT